jgi:hypothetical protein
MLKNKLMKLWILGINLSLSYNLSMATEDSQESILEQVTDSVKTWQASEASPAEKEKAKAFFKKQGIKVSSIYKPKDVERAWEKDLEMITPNVVRINILTAEGELRLPTIGTGTLVKAGTEDCQGIFVLTCAHCVFNEYQNWKPKDKPSINTPGTISTYYLERKNFSGKRNISVTPEIEQTTEEIPLLNTQKDWEVALKKETAHAIKGAYFFRNNGDAHLLDICIVVLEKPIMFKSKNIGGVPLNSLDPKTQYEEGAEEKLGHVANINSKDLSVIVGFGLTGLAIIKEAIGQTLDQAVGEEKLKERQDLLKLLGWNKKKAVLLQGLDIMAKQDCAGCRCKEEFVKECPTKATFGFSGSLIVKPKMNAENKTWDTFGLLSGPEFTAPLKEALIQAIKNHSNI